LRDADCEIEREGIRRSKTQLERADLFLYVMDASTPIHPDDRHWLKELESPRLIVILNKTDLGRIAAAESEGTATIVETSLKDHRGVDELRRAISAKLNGRLQAGEHHAVISERHRALLVQASGRVAAAITLVGSADDGAVVLASAELKDALEALGRVTGRIYENELLDSIFSRFCIGK
jgi:tRNA modification GTPase